ncbi:DNA-binding protein [Chytriomyces cf. hyalinus JEL632]|nr:DNA-binding protein [Chytriomyces cf. hyalinus JEL632]
MDASLVDCIVDFLEVGIHTILYERKVYPGAVFTRTQKYSLSVYRSRHPALNGYIKDFLRAVRPDLMQGSLSKVHVFVFRVRDVYDHVTQQSKQNSFASVSIVEVESYFYTLLQRLCFIDGSLTANPPDCTFNLLCELIDGKEFPRSYEQDVAWVQAESSISHVSHSRVSPFKTLDAGVVKLDMYVEECCTK